MLSKIFVFKLIVLVFVVKLNLISGLDKKTHCTCKTNVQPNIVGGREILFNELPWMASMIDKKGHKCTSFALNELWVLTSKKCTEKDLIYSVGFGNDKLDMFDKKIQVKKVNPHPNPEVDMSLLELTEPINFDENFRPACVDTKQYEKIKNQNPDLMAAGYGKNTSYMEHKQNSDIFFYHEENDKYVHKDLAQNIDSRYLKKVDMKEVFLNEHFAKLSISNIWTQNKIPDHTVCIGDEGGPLHYTYNGKKFVIGLLSSRHPTIATRGNFEIFCTGINSALYTKIAPQIDWIERHLGKNNYCDDNISEGSPQQGFKLFGKTIYPGISDDPKGKRPKLSYQ